MSPAFNFYLGVQETNSTVNPVDLNNCPAGAVRLMTNAVSEVNGRANRTRAVWGAGLYPIPCLKTQAVGTAAEYRTQVRDFLDIITPVGLPMKSEVFEVGNEPGQGTYPPGTDLAYYLDCLVNSYDLIRARGLKVILAAMTQGAKYTPPGGQTIYGPAAVSRAITNGYRGARWWMIDHAAIHVYADQEGVVPGGVLSAIVNLRHLFPADKGLWLTECGWPSGKGGPFKTDHTEADRINHILNLFAGLKNRAEELNLQGWSWFSNSDYNNASDAYERCGLVNLSGVKKSGTAVVRTGTQFGAGSSFTRSWDAMNYAANTAPTTKGVFPIAGGVLPPPNPPPPPPAPPSIAAAVVKASPRLLEAVKKTHTLALTAEVLRDGDVVAEPEVTGGSVTYDARAAVRATLDLTLVDDGSLGWVPNVNVAPLAPYGNEIRVSRGVHYDDGTEDLVSLGIFRINEIEAQDTGDGLELRLTGTDRAQSVSDAKFEVPYNVPSGTLFTTAITDVVGAVIDVETRFVGTEIRTPGLIAEEGDDRWEFAQGLATALGAELYFDADGVLVLAPIPGPSDDPVAELVEGEGGVLLEASKRWSRTDAFNVVIVTAENSDVNPPIRSVREDTNPLSPTYAYPGARFGRVPRFYTNQYITTQDQADDVAAGILRAELGVTQQVDFGAVVDPTLRASDVVLIRRAKLGISEAHIIDSLTIPLDSEGAMTGQTRLSFPQVITGHAGHLLLSPETLLFAEQVLF